VEEAFLKELLAKPADEATWLALADWFQEHGQQQRAELVRLMRRLQVLPLREQSDERTRMQARLAELLNGGVRPVVPELVNSISMRLALIPPGVFLMGSPAEEEGRSADEGPLHEVEITRPFYLGVFPVTQGQWRAVMGHNPSCFCARGHFRSGKDRVKGLNTDDFPVECVSWDDVTVFLAKLAALKKEVEARREYRLPTEAEWEYACRGGPCSSTPFHLGNSLSSTQASFDGRFPYGEASKRPYRQRTCAVGSYRPNAFGLYDMHGAVFEWCADWYDKDYYKTSPRRDPQGPSEGRSRVRRGGGWNSNGWSCRAARRSGNAPFYRLSSMGFRVVAVPRE
jgi:uncharacterized protein (TIGR02996 family)